MIEYRSTDSSAPVITGEAGKLNDALKAILVDGYGSKSAAGWTRPYASGSVAAFRQGSGHQRYLSIDDSDARMARVIGYDSMTGASTGTNPFPTSAQISGGLYMRKSITADTTARPWACWADARTFYLVIFGSQTTADGSTGGDSHMGYGETVAVPLRGDRYNTFLAAATDSSATSTTATSARQVLTAFSTTATGHYMPGGIYQTAASISPGKRSPNCIGMVTSGVNPGTTLGYPEVDGNINLSRMYLWHNTIPQANRGAMPGIWCIGHHVSGNMTLYDTLSGATGTTLDGRTFVIVRTGGSGGFAIETTDGSWNG